MVLQRKVKAENLVYCFLHYILENIAYNYVLPIRYLPKSYSHLSDTSDTLSS